MSTWKSGIIAEGDVVILYGGKERINSVKMQKGKTFSSKFGNWPHSVIIGKPFGSKILDKDGGWIIALSPTPELYTAGAITHRTQIIFTTDISAITLYLELKPGSIVVESGTGSGSLSRAIARTIAPNGHLYTFEYHEQRANLARESFIESGLGKLITVTNRDACEQGYALDTASVDAVMLDLPSPWLAIPHAAKVLRHYGMICNFSPCIEQVQKACEALRQNGFSDIVTIECLLRPFEVKTVAFDSIIPPVQRKRKQEPPSTAGSTSSSTTALASPSVQKKTKAKKDDEGDDEEKEDEEDNKPPEEKQEDENGDSVSMSVATSALSMPPAAPSSSSASPAPASTLITSALPTASSSETVPFAPSVASSTSRPQPGARPETAIRGHTSFLTFARRIIL